MKRFSSKIRRVVERLKHPFLSQAQRALRAALELEARDQNAREAERLDRLRNPGNYRKR